MGTPLPTRNGSGNGFMLAPTASDGPSIAGRPTVDDLRGNNTYAQTAHREWLGKESPEVQKNVVDEIWNSLEKDGFPFKDLLLLENEQMLEKYLWPGYSEDASNRHIMLLALLINVKRRENLPTWEFFSSRPADFSSFFRRVLSMTVDLSLPVPMRTRLVTFVIGAFQSLENGLVRKECAPLVSIAIWQNLHAETAKDTKLEENSMLKKAWRAAMKRFEVADTVTKPRLHFERSWLFTLLLDFMNKLYDDAGSQRDHVLLYCERFMELLIDLQSQLPTRRYVNTLIHDLNLLPAIILSPLFTDEDNGLFRDLFNLLQHYTYFPIDDQTGQAIPRAQSHQAHYARLAKLQRLAIKHLDTKLRILALSNYASLDQRSELESHLETLDDGEVVDLCRVLGFRTKYSGGSLVVLDRKFYTETLVSAHERRPTFQESVKDLTVLPTESTLYESSFLRSDAYTGSRPLAVPKLNLQYLTIGDFLWRAFVLYRCESFYAIRNDIEGVVKRLQPRMGGGAVCFDGFSRMALQINKPAVINVGLPNVGESIPSEVRVEIILDVGRLNPGIRAEWESLRADDVVFLVAVQPTGSTAVYTNGHTGSDVAEKLGIRHIRCAEVVQVQDENGKTLRERQARVGNGAALRARQRRLILRLDVQAYAEDTERVIKGKPSIYESINVIIRRRGRENNFKPVLESIKRLTLSDVPTPAWLQDVFLGYGDPAGATYKRLPNRLKSIDFRDTFLNWQHLSESLPGKILEPSEDKNSSFPPPYVLEIPDSEPQQAPVRTSKKRRRDQVEITQPPESVKVATYEPPNTGPYPADAPKLNTVRFTPAQIEAIASGSQPGLTVIVGPPGTGKTDVATQIINNIYHNFPEQRTLLIAHSNQALNQLFLKIAALDIDERHLLRLGHGEEELDSDTSYSKHGRVESFLENGARYLAEVNRLAVNFGAPGAHGNSCETADYFNTVYIKPAWAKYSEVIESDEADVEQVIEQFPFHQYFSNAPQPLFPPESSKEDVLKIVQGCYTHIKKIFTELADIRPFEILRNDRDKANYLLVKEARIIAMTTTHAAMRRQSIASLGFHYDNIIMEEAAQITEIETFIPMALQNPKDGVMPLQRVVLCGDHLQNSPIIQNFAFRQYANLEQSLFLRLVRLGVPTIMLDQQGRARPSLAALYKWRYPKLGNLQSVETSAEFQVANPGFRFEYQFIHVPDYKGKGEMEPTPHFIQNLGEAEYAVALFMYMRLLGYPASKISILATYAGQRALIRDVLNHRCKDNRLFGLPRIVTTVDKYQGEQNDYIILSLTRTRSVGFLRDVRRLTVALSRARLGLYILGRREVFEPCYELKQTFDQLLNRPDKLCLVTDEMYPAARQLNADAKYTEMAGVEHLGQYVFEMTQAKVAALKANGGALPLSEPVQDHQMEDEDDDGTGLMEKEEPEELEDIVI